ncbi:MAG TPA: tRNA pseudouridine(38-40) synthase TruA [Candidatus Binataceae bacterium]|nr:tRNA pseudouridine(38-40) synthase TruA [Candidatus Binataceae bacterium]
MRFRLTLAYDGGNYCGWQLQPDKDSIQGRVEAALAGIFGTPVRVYAAGRTDAGVHARGQVASFDAPRPFEAADLLRALNAILPRDIAVIETIPVDDDFDPRRDARSRIYEYRILNRGRRSAFDYRYAWRVGLPLEIELMNAAATRFIGEHDFAAFRSLGSEEPTTVRRVIVSEWRCDGGRLVYRVEATAFLRHMVRTMVGAMVAVGNGKLTPEHIDALIEGRDRGLAPAAVPAHGLFLVAVRY